MSEHLIPMYNVWTRFWLSLHWGVRYKFGAKFSDPRQEHPIGRTVDCSGYMRWLVFHGSDHALLLPDGSVNQHAFIVQQGFPVRDYGQAMKDRTNTFYICFFSPTSRLAGHVWGLYNGETMESHWPTGISKRNGNILRLMGRKIYCYRMSA